MHILLPLLLLLLSTSAPALAAPTRISLTLDLIDNATVLHARLTAVPLTPAAADLPHLIGSRPVPLLHIVHPQCHAGTLNQPKHSLLMVPGSRQERAIAAIDCASVQCSLPVLLHSLSPAPLAVLLYNSRSCSSLLWQASNTESVSILATTETVPTIDQPLSVSLQAASQRLLLTKRQSNDTTQPTSSLTLGAFLVYLFASLVAVLLLTYIIYWISSHRFDCFTRWRNQRRVRRDLRSVLNNTEKFPVFRYDPAQTASRPPSANALHESLPTSDADFSSLAASAESMSDPDPDRIFERANVSQPTMQPGEKYEEIPLTVPSRILPSQSLAYPADRSSSSLQYPNGGAVGSQDTLHSLANDSVQLSAPPFSKLSQRPALTVVIPRPMPDPATLAPSQESPSTAVGPTPYATNGQRMQRHRSSTEATAVEFTPDPPTHIQIAEDMAESPLSAESIEHVRSATSTTHTTCSICLEDYNSGDQIRELPCLHHFHGDCIRPWFERALNDRLIICPVCRSTWPVPSHERRHSFTPSFLRHHHARQPVSRHRTVTSASSSGALHHNRHHHRRFSVPNLTAGVSSTTNVAAVPQQQQQPQSRRSSFGALMAPHRRASFGFPRRASTSRDERVDARDIPGHVDSSQTARPRRQSIGSISRFVTRSRCESQQSQPHQRASLFRRASHLFGHQDTVSASLTQTSPTYLPAAREQVDIPLQPAATPLSRPPPVHPQLHFAPLTVDDYDLGNQRMDPQSSA